jgi:hypothetical protein
MGPFEQSVPCSPHGKAPLYAWILVSRYFVVIGHRPSSKDPRELPLDVPFHLERVTDRPWSIATCPAHDSPFQPKSMGPSLWALSTLALFDSESVFRVGLWLRMRESVLWNSKILILHLGSSGGIRLCRTETSVRALANPFSVFP